MGFDLISKVKKSYGDYQNKKAKEKADEEARQKTILAGEIEPAETDINLEKGEKAYAAFYAKRMGTVAHTISTTKKKGVAGRAVVGGLLLGPLGALGGAATAGSKTTENTTEAIEEMDNGIMTFTNKRFVFIGRESMVSLPYEKAAGVEFQKNMFGSTLILKYAEMVKGEFYKLSGKDSKISEIWFNGIKKISK